MRNDSRLSRMLHVLIHMDRHEHSATSEMIAKMLNTNPVVVNGEELSAYDSARALNDGDQVELGEVVLRFRSH